MTDTAEFRELLGCLPTGVAVITTVGPGGRQMAAGAQEQALVFYQGAYRELTESLRKLRDMGSRASVLSLRDPKGNVVQLFRRAPRPVA